MAPPPRIVSEMKQLQDRIPEDLRAKVRFVLVSIDPGRPETLKDFASRRGLDPRTWTLYSGPESSVRELSAILGVSYRKETNGEFSHTYIITLLDSKGVIAHQNIGANQPAEPILALLSR